MDFDCLTDPNCLSVLSMIKKLPLSGCLFLLWTACFNALHAQNFNLQLRSKITFPAQTLANVWGYTQDGREYVLAGGSLGLIIVDVTNPDTPQTIVQIPGANNLWKEIKTYKYCAYVTTEGTGQGLQVIDLRKLPSPDLDYYNYRGDGPIADQLDRIHALHMDTTAGFLYLYGSGLFSGGALVLDLNDDPYAPKYAGKFDQLGYVHDGYANNDTLYGSHIYAGVMSIVDMHDKSNPILLGAVQTPGRFTHNSWLQNDGRYIFTTDETTPSFVTAYDISDPDDIIELDRFSTNDGNESIGHNTHNANNWLVTSWYTDGVVITDAHRPDNLVMTGWYDTWPGTGANFNGCWGAYPFFPSGTIAATNIEPAELFILTPTYVRACYLEGKVTSECDGNPVTGAQITIVSGDPGSQKQSDNNGFFKTGQVSPGEFTVKISKAGFNEATYTVTLIPGEATQLDAALSQPNAVNIAGTVVRKETQMPLANTPVALANSAGQFFEVQTDAAGQFALDCVAGGDYQIAAAAWGYLNDSINTNGGPVVLELPFGYYDDYGFDLGWESAGDAASGFWERGVPVQTTFQNQTANPGADMAGDTNNACYVTGNSGGGAGADDVDDGTVTLTSPPMALANYKDATLNFWYWFFNAGGASTPNDKFEVHLLNGSEEALVLVETVSQSGWRYSGDIKLSDYFPTLTNNVRVRFSASDPIGLGHIVEAAVDVFRVTPGDIIVSTQAPESAIEFSASPNPSTETFNLRFQWPSAESLRLEVRNAVGQIVLNQTLDNRQAAVLQLGANWAPGAYIATLHGPQGAAQQLKLIKL